jgi:hypothetical protein
MVTVAASFQEERFTRKQNERHFPRQKEFDREFWHGIAHPHQSLQPMTR